LELDGTGGYQHIGAQSQGVGAEVFELARLVATEGQRGEVVALDPEITTQVTRQPRQVFQGRGGGDQFKAREAGKGVGEHRASF